MKLRIVFAALLCSLIAEKTAYAHRIDEYLQATLLSVQKDRVQASMRLIPGVLVASAIIDGVDTNHDGVFSEEEERAYAHQVLGDLLIEVDGNAAHVTLGPWSFPQASQLRDGLGEIHIDYLIDLPPGGPDRVLTLVNRHHRENSVYLVNVITPEDDTIRIVGQKRNQQQSNYELDFQQTTFAARRPWSVLRAWASGVQLSSLFHLGMRHIAEGTDHLLFLLVLLLPAPLCVAGLRWRGATTVRISLLHIVGIVTAFTIGHSITLTLAAMDFVHVPGSPVEVLIAVSILVSAIHALRPIFPGREPWIAAFFGLIHGLAFASTLDRLGLSRWDRVAGILAFNFGIETMQMIVVTLILPSLLLMSRTPYYRWLRIGGATFAGAASIAWIAERLLNIRTSIDAIVNSIARHGICTAAVLLVVSLACRYLPAKCRWLIPVWLESISGQAYKALK
jgi:hypothetical protein